MYKIPKYYYSRYHWISYKNCNNEFNSQNNIWKYLFFLPIDIEHVKEEIKRCEGTQFDPQIAEVFLDILNNDFDKIKEIQEKYISE